MFKPFLSQSAVRRNVLKLLLSDPKRKWYVRELARALGHRHSSIQYQVKILAEGGHVTSVQDGNRLVVQINAQDKNSQRLRAALEELAAEAEAAPRKARGRPSAGRYKQMESAVAAHKAEMDRLSAENRDLRTGKQTHEKKSKDLAERLKALTAELQSEQVRADVSEADCRRLEQGRTRLEKEAADRTARAGRLEADLKTALESNEALQKRIEKSNRECEKREKTIERLQKEAAEARGREKDLNEKIGALSAELEAARKTASESGGAIVYFCPNPICRKKHSAPASSAGHRGKCKTCGLVHVIPDRSDPAAEESR